MRTDDPLDIAPPATQDTRPELRARLVGMLERTPAVLRTLRIVRAPLIVALGAAYVLSSIPQVREIYRAMAQDFRLFLPQLVLAVPILCAAAIALSLIARELLRAAAPRAANGLLRRLLPLVCGLLLPFGLAFGLFLAAWETRIGVPPERTLAALPAVGALLSDLRTARTVLYVEAGFIALVAATLLLPNIGFRSSRFRRLVAARSLRIGRIALFGLACLIFFSIFQVSGAQLVGPLGIFLLAIVFFASITALLTKVGDRLRLPLLSLVILWALLVSVFDLTDNHEVALSPSDHPGLERAVKQFEQWYDARKDREWYETRNVPYPVFVVAASGGGLYAAQHVATVLSRLQDQCPNFAQHVFAISGVSGGSLGGALFSSMARTMASNAAQVDCELKPDAAASGPFETMADRFIGNDFLSPVLAAAFFPDAVQRFLPVAWSRVDRAKAFESGLSKVWLETFPQAKDDVWSQPFLQHWDPTKAAPALILNMTNVEHGNRVAATPFAIIDWAEIGNIVSLSNLAEFHDLSRIKSEGDNREKMRDISLAAATSLSARFPWVMPAGRLEFQSGTMRMVDGGYVENSGTETALDLIYTLSRFYNQNSNLRGNRPPVKFIVLTTTNLQILRSPGSSGLSEILSPIRTMLSTREARAVVSIGHLSRFTELCGVYSECGDRVDAAMFMLNLYDHRLPLGWLLAHSTRSVVRLYSGSAGRAGEFLGGSNIDDADLFSRLGAYASRNDTAACKIASLLDRKERSCG